MEESEKFETASLDSLVETGTRWSMEESAIQWGAMKPVLDFIAAHGQDAKWCKFACQYLMESCPEEPGAQLRSRLGCLALISQWNQEKNDPAIAEFAIKALTRILGWFGEGRYKDWTASTEAEVGASSLWCLSILSNVPTDRAFHFLQEVARDNSANEFGQAALQMQVIASRVCEAHPGVYGSHG